MFEIRVRRTIYFNKEELKSRKRRDYMSDFAASLTIVNYIFDGIESFRVHHDLNELKDSIKKNQLLDIKLARLAGQSLEGSNGSN
jgi:hypothetical protein